MVLSSVRFPFPYTAYLRFAGRYWIVTRRGPGGRPVLRQERYRDGLKDQETEELFLYWHGDKWHITTTVYLDGLDDAAYTKVVLAYGNDPAGNMYEKQVPVGLKLRCPVWRGKLTVSELVVASGSHSFGAPADLYEILDGVDNGTEAGPSGRQRTPTAPPTQRAAPPSPSHIPLPADDDTAMDTGDATTANADSAA